MADAINVDIRKTGFSVKLGDIDLYFDSSIENLRRFFNVEELARKRLREAQERAENIHFPKGIENYDIDDFTEMDIEKIDVAFDAKKEFIAAQYDLIFGEGTFERIYKKYPDVLALEKAFEPLGLEISKRLEEQANERKPISSGDTGPLH